MINHPNSTQAAWLKYPVLLLATLTVATLFTRSKAQTLTKFIPESAAHVVATVMGAQTAKTQPTPASTATLTDSLATGLIPSERRVDDARSVADSPQKQASAPATVRVSPSRYMQYEGDRLYWIVTPKTSFDDLAIMKREFEQHGYKMQVQALKYDPLDFYITDVKITIIRPIVGTSDFEETGVDGKPIQSYGGFNGLNKSNNVAVVDSYPFDEDFLHLPRELMQTLREEEASVATFIRTNRSKYLMTAGQKVSTQYGTCSNVTNVDGLLARPDITQKHSITLSADGTLAIADTRLPLFIDNKPVANELLKRINVKMFKWIMFSEVCGQNGQPGVVKALLFYTNEP